MTVDKDDLQAISDYVNWRFNYTSDVEQRGVPEHWVDVSELEFYQMFRWWGIGTATPSIRR